MRAPDTLFSGSYSPLKTRWWSTVIQREPYERDYGHAQVLRDMVLWGRSAEETESLAYCYDRVVNQGARSASGLWCICLKEEAPSAGEARGSIGGDGMAALVATKSDLEMAADQLPISWSTTQQIFEAQGRNLLYQGRFLTYRQNLRVREIDRWAEPRDEETGRPKSRALAHYLMAMCLGWKTVCAWPKPGSLVQRDVFRALAQPAQQLEEIAA